MSSIHYCRHYFINKVIKPASSRLQLPMRGTAEPISGCDGAAAAAAAKVVSITVTARVAMDGAFICSAIEEAEDKAAVATNIAVDGDSTKAPSPPVAAAKTSPGAPVRAKTPLTAGTTLLEDVDMSAEYSPIHRIADSLVSLTGVGLHSETGGGFGGQTGAHVAQHQANHLTDALLHLRILRVEKLQLPQPLVYSCDYYRTSAFHTFFSQKYEWGLPGKKNRGRSPDCYYL